MKSLGEEEIDSARMTANILVALLAGQDSCACSIRDNDFSIKSTNDSAREIAKALN